MPVFDPALGRIVVRIVYDGPGTAGKTTNIQQLSQVFSAARRSEVKSPEQTAGRTTFFDWLSIDSGLIQGHPLRTEFVTVPGQRVLARRRMALLDHADAVVFVVDSRRGRLAESAQMFSVLRAHLLEGGRDGCPIVVQVNKQDMLGAVSVSEVRGALELADDVPAIGAEAFRDVGVRETAVVAIRAAASRAQAIVLSGGLESMLGSCGSAEALKAHLEALDAQVGFSPAAFLREQAARPHEASPAEEDGSEAEDVTGAPAPLDLAWSPREAPVLPRSDAESGCVWPATTGRDVLREIEHREARRSDTGHASGTGTRAEAWGFRVGEYAVRTSADRSDDDLDGARRRLVTLARAKLHLAELVPPSTVLSVQKNRDGRYYVWTTAAWVEPLDAVLRSATEDKDEARVGDALESYARCLVAAGRLCVEQGVLLELGADAFAAPSGTPLYVSDDIRLGAELPSLGRAIVSVVQEFAAYPAGVERFTSELLHVAEAQLSIEGIRALRLVELIEGVSDSSR